MLEKISDLLKKKKKIECVMFERPLKKKKRVSLEVRTQLCTSQVDSVTGFC